MTKGKKLDGKRALITGAGTGIGRGIAMEFAEEGATVVLHYAHSNTGADSAVSEIRAFGGKAKAIKADFRELKSIKKLAQQSLNFLDGLDILVNNAGITMNVPFEKVTPEQFDTLIDVNLKAQFFLTQFVLPAMTQEKKGAVINLTSVHAFAGYVEHSVYAATKGAIVALTREVALELIQKGIRVNSIAPGWIRVENQEKTLGKDFDWESAQKTVPAGFVANPRDVGKLAVFLASEESRFIIGQTLVIDGGQLAIMPNTGDFRQPVEVQYGQGYVKGLQS